MSPSTSRPSCTGCAASSPRPRTAYREASHWGREPQPGLALLRLAQGQVDAAEAAHPSGRRRGRGTGGPVPGAGPLRRDHAGRGRRRRGARAAPTSWRASPPTLDAPFAARARRPRDGARSSLAEGEARAALPVLREAWTAWRAARGAVRGRPGPRPDRARLPRAGRPRHRRDGARRRPARLRAARRGAPTSPGSRRWRAREPRAARAASPPASGGARARRHGQDQPRDLGQRWSSASTPWPATCRTSSPSSASPRAPRPPPSPTSTTSSEHELTTRRAPALVDSGDAGAVRPGPSSES